MAPNQVSDGDVFLSSSSTPSHEVNDVVETRDVDVMSEPPEIDTSWVQEEPKTNCWIWISIIVAIPFISFLVALFVSILFYSTLSKCSVTEILEILSRFNNSEIESEVRGMYSQCKV